MKTLDLARAIFSDETKMAAAKKARGKKSSMSIDQYENGAYSFDVDEYFKKLCTNSSVRMVTLLLEKYRSNEAAVNHYIYSFLNRMMQFQMQQSFPTPHPSAMRAKNAVQSAANGILKDQGVEEMTMSESLFTPATRDSFSLGSLLFNVRSIGAIAAVLNDVSIQKNRNYAPLLSLARSVIVAFGHAAEKNKLLYVECLFQHAHPTKHAERIDSLYEAQAFKPNTAYAAERANKEKKKAERSEEHDVFMSDEEEEGGGLKATKADRDFIQSDSDNDFGDEFDETAENMQVSLILSLRFKGLFLYF